MSADGCRIGCVFAPTVATPEHIALAEELGYAYAFVYDSPTFLADAWMTLALAARQTSTIKLGVSVITPRLRHLVANAGAIAHLAALAPDRVEVVVGSGFTSQLMLGQRPATWAEVERYVLGLRAVLAGEDIGWDGATIGLRHGQLSGVRLPISLPIRMAAHGPKGYAAAARSGDGIVTNLNHHSANTGPDEMRGVLSLYYGTVLEPGEDPGSPRSVDAAGPGAAFQLHIGGEGLIGESEEWLAYQRALDALDPAVRHLEIHRGHLLEVTDLERPLLTGDLITRTTGTGSGEQVRAAIAAITARGVEGILYGPMGSDIPRELTAFAQVADLAE